MSSAMIWIGMDVHKDTVMAAVYLDNAQEPEIVQQLVNDTRKLKRFFDRWSRRGEIRSCYEASGAGYVLQRQMTDWGYGCEVVAPSLIPIRARLCNRDWGSTDLGEHPRRLEQATVTP